MTISTQKKNKNQQQQKNNKKNKKTNTKTNTKTNITWFFPQILMIKEPCNLIGSKAQTTSHTQPRGPITCYLHLMTISIYKKSMRMSDSSQRYWWPKNHTIWLDKRHNWPHPPKVEISDAPFSWWLTQGKKTEINLHAKS